MNDDRCTHFVTSPGQSVCTCLDRRMFLELLVELQARRIVELEKRVQHEAPHLVLGGTGEGLHAHGGSNAAGRTSQSA